MNKHRSISLIAAALVTCAGTTVSGQNSTQPARPSDTNRQIQPGGAIQRDGGTRLWATDSSMSQPTDMQRWLQKFAGTWKVEAQEFDSPLSAGKDGRAADGDKRDQRDRDDNRKRDAQDKQNGNMQQDGARSDRDRDPSTGGMDSTGTDRAGAANRGGGSASKTSQFTARTEMVHGGKHAKTTVRGDYNGQEFEGVRMLGYNSRANRFESFWMDNMSSGMAMMTGQLDSAQKVLTLEGECPNSDSARMIRSREVTRWINDDQYVSELYLSEAGNNSSSNNNEHKVMVLTFNRVRGSDSAGYPDSQIKEPSGSQTNPR